VKILLIGIAAKGSARGANRPVDGCSARTVAKRRRPLTVRSTESVSLLLRCTRKLPAWARFIFNRQVEYRSALLSSPIDGLCPFTDPAFSDHLIHVRPLLSCFRTLRYPILISYYELFDDNTHFVICQYEIFIFFTKLRIAYRQAKCYTISERQVLIMGYGQNLKNILDEKGMTVKELAKKVGIAPTTLYSIIQRDTAVRFDTALKISHILNIPINSICKDNPYEPGETLPILPSDNEKLMINLQKKAYFSDRTLKLVEIFDYTELPHIDQLIADFFVLNDTARSDLFEYIKIMKNNHTDPKRKKILNKL